MEENLLTAIPDFKLYKDRAIYVGTFLGGPLAAGYLITENFKKLGQFDKVKISWLISISVTILIIVVVLFVPGIEKIPPYILPIIYALIAQALMKKHQVVAINAHIEKGGQVYSIWRAVLVGFISAAILFGALFLLLLLTNSSILA